MKKIVYLKVCMHAESETAIGFCDENGIDVVYGVCVMVARRREEAP